MTLAHQAVEPPLDVPVDLDELDGGVPGTKVVAPTAQDRIDRGDHVANVHPSAASASQRFDPRSDAIHRPLRRPALEVVATNAAFQQPTRYTGVEMAAEEIEPLPAFTEVNQSRLLRVQLQPQPGQHLAGESLGFPGLGFAAASHDEVVRIADECAVRPVNERLIQRVQIDVREQRGDDCSHAKGNWGDRGLWGSGSCGGS